MQERLWHCSVTPKRCTHVVPQHCNTALKVGPDVAEVIGFSIPGASRDVDAYRVIIVHTRKDPDVRWYAIVRNAAVGLKHKYRRKVMLRSLQCCDQCALSFTASKPGKWLLIL
jgi:hypothetical protein